MKKIERIRMLFVKEWIDVEGEEITNKSIRISCKINSQEVGRAYLYILKNDLHEEPFGLIEDVFVNEDFRDQGMGKFLICKAIKIATEHNCYKIIATSREERQEVHKLYKKLGFEKYGIEFRVNLK